MQVKKIFQLNDIVSKGKKKPEHLISNSNNGGVSKSPKKSTFKILSSIISQSNTIPYPSKQIQSRDNAYSEAIHSENTDNQNPYGADNMNKLIPEQEGPYIGRKTLVLDLDETLVHSSFIPISNPDIVIPVILTKVEIESKNFQVYVLKRPFLDEFLRSLSCIFELIIFTASLAKVIIISTLTLY